jgi:hypothetical protein
VAGDINLMRVLHGFVAAGALALCLRREALGAVLAMPAGAQAEGGLFDWVHGDWKLIVGATGMVAPDFEGSRDRMFSVSPIISLGLPDMQTTFRHGKGKCVSRYPPCWSTWPTLPATIPLHNPAIQGRQGPSLQIQATTLL